MESKTGQFDSGVTPKRMDLDEQCGPTRMHESCYWP